MTNSAMSQRYKRPLKLWFHGFDRELCTALCTVGQTSKRLKSCNQQYLDLLDVRNSH